MCPCRAGLYKLPWDMTTLGHRQANPLFVLRQAAAFVQEAADTLGRRDRQADTSVWLDSKLYPDYYRSTFHYQVWCHFLPLPYCFVQPSIAREAMLGCTSKHLCSTLTCDVGIVLHRWCWNFHKGCQST